MKNRSDTLPFDAVIFDLDGVITQTAMVHQKAWKQVFNQFMVEYSREHQVPNPPFEEDDYLRYVDGKPRYDGVQSFLLSRGIHLPMGSPDDSPEDRTVCGVGNRKNVVFQKILSEEGVEVFPSTVAFIHQLHQHGIRTGVASSSRNCRMLLEQAGLLSRMEVIVDGVVSAEQGLQGKPAPDIFIRAADLMGVKYDRCVVVEDALSGVEAGRIGGFGLVLGVARQTDPGDMYDHGADWVVRDLEEISISRIADWFKSEREESSWCLTFHGFDPGKELSRETLLTVGNGLTGTRGAMEESSPDGIHYPGSYMAGVYNKLASDISGRRVENEDLVNITQWTSVNFRIDDGPWLGLDAVKIISLKRTLHLRNGQLVRDMTVKDSEGRISRIVSARLASMKNAPLTALSYTVTPVNYSGTITFRSGLSAAHINDGVKRYRSLNQQHLAPVHEWVYGPFQHVEAVTTQSAITLLQTAKVTLNSGLKEKYHSISGFCSPGKAQLLLTATVEAGESVTLEKSVWTEMTKPGVVSDHEAVDQLHRMGGFQQMLNDSEKVWKKLWRQADLTVRGDHFIQRLLRLHIYHLLSVSSFHNLSLKNGIPARGLSGEAYRGHIFWDEVYILPWLSLTFPRIARSVLMYRYHRLDAARRYAKLHGERGAMFPWQSGSSGEEETQQSHYNPVSGTWGDDNSSLQRHISLAIAYNILTYYHVSGDQDFINRYGMEMLIEIGRFWAGKAQFDPIQKRYSIVGVMGPDEFHEHCPGVSEAGLKDNAYTNIMVAWLLQESVSLIHTLEGEALGRLHEMIHFDLSEITSWSSIASNLYLDISEEGIIAQFDGYLKLDELDLNYYQSRYGDIHRLDRILKAEGKSPDQYKVAKQADTLMVFYLLDPETVTRLISGMGYHLPDDFLQRNFQYYLSRTTHGSTLSRVVYAWLAHLAGDQPLAMQLYREALVSDFGDIQGGTTGEGIHAGVMGGTVMLALKMFGGIDWYRDKLACKPALPPPWKKMSFSLIFQNNQYNFTIQENRCRTQIRSAPPANNF